MAFFTGKGDKGTTKLFDTCSGTRVAKSSHIFECLGQLDELNTIVGWCKAACPRDFSFQAYAGKDILHDVQDHLFTLQAEVAGAPKSIPQSSVERMSALIGDIEKDLPEIKSFLVPGGTEFSSRLDIARAISRRAERKLVILNESGDRLISESSLAYANRLSSLLYALTRLFNHHSGSEESAPKYRDHL